MAFYRSTNARVFYDSIGERGPWLALINGHTRSSSDFRILANKLAARSLRLLLMDNRGSGQTTAEPPYTIESMADDLAGIAASLGITQLAILGISLGGVIAQCFATQHPDLISQLVLVSTAKDKSYFQPTKQWPRDQAHAEELLAPLVSATFRRKNPLLFQALCKNIMQQSQEGEFLRRADHQRAALFTYLDKDHNLGLITCPTLILHGEEDAIIPCQAAQDLQQAIAHAHLHHFAEAGHLLLVEKPAELVDLILSFMDQGA